MQPIRVLFTLALLPVSMNLTASAQEPDDPHRWLEEVEGERALGWVEQRSEAALAELRGHPEFDAILRRNLEILSSRERIAHPTILGERIYNFWQDDEHPRGIWRRASWERYLAGEPDWEVVLDVDALAREEGVNWVYKGASCLPPDHRRCLVELSRGGADATQVRELDLESGRWVEGGFFLPEAKNSVSWIDRETLLVATDFGPGSMTGSGYPRTARVWRRGTPLEQAPTLFAADSTDVGVWTAAERERGTTRVLVAHRVDFFRGSYHLLDGDRLVKLDLPPDADLHLVDGQLVVYLRSAWEVGGAAYPVGSVVSTDLDAFLRGGRDFAAVVIPGERQTVEAVRTTRGSLLVSLLSDVRGELHRFRRTGGRWAGERVPAPEMGSVTIGSTSDATERYFFTFSGFLQPTTLYLADEDGTVREVQRMPEMFDAGDRVVSQFQAVSRDGTRVPYFVVHPRDARMDGSHPTLLYAYGGYQVSLTPAYSPIVGSAWLERGGVYAVANIRGGGEFGPAWHRAAQKENRQRAFDDFFAVAEDLIARGITSPRHLGIMGGSNGGLLVGAALTQRPELFGAVVSTVPLLDMRRYHRLLAGASWMAEYGDPDRPEEWEYIGRYSPYHNVRAGRRYPPTLLYTTTRDDRVHPGHARKMAARLEETGHPVLYYENTEGGHGAGVTPEQQARMWAIVYTYLLQQLR